MKLEETFDLESKINERLEKESKKIIEKEDLSKEDIDILQSVLSNIHMKRLKQMM